eukprot:TRINITY_DN2511_c0_g1_i2.p1 TRINITY_DN2511_c0_g1~~TRINITY_DN2511_c0_g1_i2.p1  ORF type:complete len:237 (+),score=49.60 TRINITY_DN2511_c0_g1_i2:256-966(+)
MQEATFSPTEISDIGRDEAHTPASFSSSLTQPLLPPSSRSNAGPSLQWVHPKEPEWKGDIILCCYGDLDGCKGLKLCCFSATCPCFVWGRFIHVAGFGCAWFHSLIFTILFMAAELVFLYYTFRMQAGPPETDPTSFYLQFWTIQLAFGVIIAAYLAFYRWRFREQHGIKGSGEEDFCAAFWCGPCAICQLMRTATAASATDPAAPDVEAAAAAFPDDDDDNDEEDDGGALGDECR